MTNLERSARAVGLSRSQQEIDSALADLSGAYAQVSAVLGQLERQLLQREIQHQSESPRTGSRLREYRAQFERRSGKLAAAYGSLMRETRIGGDVARRAAAEFESQVHQIGSPDGPIAGNPLSHRLAQPPKRDFKLPASSLAKSRLQAAGPTSADLASTDDAAITPEITALANQLHKDPIQIYSYVRNKILYDPYFGSRKGSLLTLWEESGNDFDTASLLVALLRASGIPSRYVEGTVAVPSSALENWVGNAADLNAAQGILAAGGVPLLLGSDGTPLLQHVWVETFDTSQSAWVPLDASFKQFSYAPMTNLAAAAGFDPGHYVAQVISSGSVVLNDQAESFRGMPSIPSSQDPEDDKQNTDLSFQAASTYEHNLQTVISSTTTNQAALGGPSIIQQQFTSLAGALPLSVIITEPAARFSEIPDNLRDRVTLSVFSNDGTSQFTWQANYPSLANKRVIVSYEPATDFDAEEIQFGGGTQITADPLLIDLVPVLRVNGTEVARGASIGMGDLQTRRVIITSASGTVETGDNSVSVGGMFALGLGYGRSSANAIAASQARLTAAIKALPTTAAGILNVNDPGNMSEPVIGETINMMMQTWFSQLDAYSEIIARSLGVRCVRAASAGIAAQPVLIDYFFGIPFGTKGGGLFFDIQSDEIAATSLNNLPQDAVTFMETTGMISSALEHSVIELLGYQSLSTMQVLSQALEEGATIYRIDGSNRAAVMNKLSYVLSSGEQTAINAALDAGNVVRVPDMEVQIGNWSGTGYIITNPATGGGGFIISGGLSGDIGSLSGGTVVMALESVAAYALADANILLNAYFLAASASALLLAPEITVLGTLAPLMLAFGLASSIASLNGLNAGTVSSSQYIVQTVAGLLVGVALSYAVSAALGLGEAGIISLGSGGVPDAFAELDAGTNGAATALSQVGFSQTEVAGYAENGINTADGLNDLAAMAQRFGVGTVRQLMSNSFYGPGSDYPATFVTQLISEVPDKPGLSVTVTNLAGASNGGFVTELEVAKQYQDALVAYSETTSVTYMPPTFIDGKLGVGSSSVIADLQGDLILNDGTWIEVKGGGSPDIKGLADQLLKGEAAVQDQQTGVAAYKMQFTQQIDQGDLDELIAFRNQYAKDVTLLDMNGNPFPNQVLLNAKSAENIAARILPPYPWRRVSRGQSTGTTVAQNAFSLSGTISPGCLVLVNGPGLPSTASAGATIGGESATIFQASTTQWLVQIPSDLAPGQTTIQIGAVPAFGVTLTQFAPALESADSSGAGLIAALHGGATPVLVNASSTAKPGEVLEIYATGFGASNAVGAFAGTPSVSIAGTPVTILSTTLSTFLPGVYVIDVQLPAALPSGKQPIQLSIAGLASNTLTLPVGAAPTITAVLNSASLAPGMAIAPASLVTVSGVDFGHNDQTGGFQATNLSGVSVTFNGIPAPILALKASTGTINVLAPAELPTTGNVTVEVTGPDGPGGGFTVTMAPSAPGVYYWSSKSNSNLRNAMAMIVPPTNNTQWWAMPPSLAQELNYAGNCREDKVIFENCGEPARVGDNLVIYLTGLGETTPNGDPNGAPLPTGAVAPANGSPLYMTIATPVVTIGGVPASVSLSALVPGGAGRYQIQTQVPAGVPIGDTIPVVISMPGGLADGRTSIAIGQ